MRHVQGGCRRFGADRFQGRGGFAARDAEQDDLVARIRQFHLGAQHVHAELFQHRRLNVGGELEQDVAIVAPDQKIGEQAAFRIAEAAAFCAIAREMLHVVGQEVVQESRRILAAGADQRELGQWRHDGGRGGGLEFRLRVAEILRLTRFEAGAAFAEEILPVHAGVLCTVEGGGLL